jgi:hypothetical protein
LGVEVGGRLDVGGDGGVHLDLDDQLLIGQPLHVHRVRAVVAGVAGQQQRGALEVGVEVGGGGVGRAAGQAGQGSDVLDHQVLEQVRAVVAEGEQQGAVKGTVGYDHFTVSIDGGPVAPITLRVTHLYRREDGEWKIVHRHADRPPVDQSR